MHPWDQGGVLELDIASGQVNKRIPLAIDGNCTLSPDGRLLAVSFGGGIRVLDRASDEMVFEAHDISLPGGFQFFDDGRILVSGHLNGKVRAWHLPTSHPLGQLTARPELRRKAHFFELSPAGTGLIVWARRIDGQRAPIILGKVDSFRR